MIISQYWWCVANKEFPIKFYQSDGNEVDEINFDCMMDKEECELFIKHCDEQDNLRIIPVRVSYEI
jgi:hypothetical protein